MPLYTPNSEVTLYLSEAGLQLILNTYKTARPEEFRVVSKHYLDGDPKTEPIKLNDDGDWLDFAIRIQGLFIDMAPPDPHLGSPIPPATGQFQVVADVNVEFRDFAVSSALFPFSIKLFALCRPRISRVGAQAFIGIDVLDLKVLGIGPPDFESLIEYVLLLLLRQAAGAVQIPTTENLASVVTLVILGVDVKDDATQVYAAIYHQSSAGSHG